MLQFQCPTPSSDISNKSCQGPAVTVTKWVLPTQKFELTQIKIGLH